MTVMTSRLRKAEERALDVFGDAGEAQAWLQALNPVLGGVAPLTMLESAEGFEQVIRALASIEYGLPP
jgi:uncharacterized protein (DUF2384 family)